MAFNGDNFLSKSGLDALWTKIKSKFLPLSGGQMTGPLSWKNGTALPGKTSDINYLLTIDAFADGGKTKYATVANVANAIAPTVESAIEDDYIMLTKQSDMVIPSNSDLNDYTQPGFYICPQSLYAKTVSNVPQATSSTTEPFPWAFSLEIQPTVMSASYTIYGVRQILRRYGDPTKTNELNNHPATWERDYYNSWGEWRRTSSIIYNAYTNNRQTSLNFPAAENGMGAMFHTVATTSTATGKPFSDANLLQMNWDTAGGYDTQLAVGTHGKWLGFRGQSTGTWRSWNYAQSINFGICETASATAAKAVTLNNTCSGIDGMEMDILFVNGDTSGAPTITVNIPGGTMGTNVQLLYEGKPVEPTYIKAGDIIKVVYHNSKWNVVGSINSVTSYANHILYYIDAQNGNDSNDGLTKNTAFKTLDKFFDVTANSGYTDVRCLLCSAGEYILNKQAANNITWHCRIHPEVTAGPVKLVGNYGVAEDWIMYNSHVKLSGLVAGDEISGVTVANTIPLVYVPYGDQGIYFENSAVTLYNVEFQCIFRLFGCYLNATGGLKAERLYFAGVNGIMEDLSITNTVNDRRAVRILRGSSLRISSPGNSSRNLGVAELTSTGTDNASVFLDVRDSEVILTSKLPSNTNQYKYGLQAVNSTITGRRTYIATFVSRCAATTILADEDSVFNCNYAEAGFTSGNGIESVDFTYTVSSLGASSTNTKSITAANLQALIYPKSGDSYNYEIIAVVPVSFSVKGVAWTKLTNTETTASVMISNYTTAAISNLSVTVRILYQMKPFSITTAS